MKNTIYIISMPEIAMTETPVMAADRMRDLQRFVGCGIPDSERLPKRIVRPRCRLALGKISTPPPIGDGESVYASILLPSCGAAERLFARHAEDTRDGGTCATSELDAFLKSFTGSVFLRTADGDVFLMEADSMVHTLMTLLYIRPEDDYVIREYVTSADGSRLVRVSSRQSIPL